MKINLFLDAGLFVMNLCISVNGTANPINSYLDGCTSCSNAFTCTACLDGYLLNEGKCKYMK